MASRRQRGGHRRTVSCSEADLTASANLPPSTEAAHFLHLPANPADPASNKQSNVPLAYESQSSTIQQLLNACSEAAEQTTVTVEQLDVRLNQDPLFQFGRRKKLVTVLDNSPSPRIIDLEGEAKGEAKGFAQSISQNSTDLFMIPEVTASQATIPAHKSKSSRVTKATEQDSPVQTRLNNLMFKSPLTASESTILDNVVFNRIKAAKRETARQRELFLTQKVKARLYLLNARAR